MLAQLARGDQGEQAGEQAVVVALGCRAVIAANGVLVGRGVDQRCLVVGVAGSGGSEFGQHGLDGGPQRRGHQAADARHFVGFLLAQHDAALAGAFFIAELAVGVQPVHELSGVLGELIGAMLGCFVGQHEFGGVTGAEVYLGG